MTGSIGVWRGDVANYADNSRLVEIFLWERRYDDAWQEASEGGCSQNLWLRVTPKREEKHPGDAVPIYQEMIPLILKQTNNAAYEEAVKLLRRIGELMTRLDRESEFWDYVAASRLPFRKRNVPEYFVFPCNSSLTMAIAKLSPPLSLLSQSGLECNTQQSAFAYESLPTG